MGKPHKHAQLIKEFVDGKSFEYLEHGDPRFHQWTDVVSLSDFDKKSCEFRIKPDRVYPDSSLTEKDFDALWKSLANVSDRYAFAFAVANLAVARFCQDQEKEGK